jgi:Flp pilus assembly protein TadG
VTPRLRSLARNRDGATAVEFALITPALLTVLLGIFELGYEIYAQTMLQGAIQQAARASTIEGAATNITAINAVVSDAVHEIVPGAQITFDRKSYTNFGDVGLPEDYTDANNNGECDNGEPFEDANGNDTWDADRGVAGSVGGARDAVLFTVTVTYDRPFPLADLVPGMSNTLTTRAATVLRNQPYDDQRVPAKTGNCV